MQVPLPQEDEEDQLYQSTRASEVLSAPEQQRNGQAESDSLLRYLIVAGLVVVVVILLNSSHQKIKIVYNAPKEGREGKEAINTVKDSLQQYSVKENMKRRAKQTALIQSEDLGLRAQTTHSSTQSDNILEKQSVRMNLEQIAQQRGQADSSEKMAELNENQSEKPNKIQQNEKTQTVKDKTEKPKDHLSLAENNKKEENHNEQKKKNTNVGEINLPKTQLEKKEQKKEQQNNEQPKAKDSIQPINQRIQEHQDNLNVEKELQADLQPKANAKQVQSGGFTVPRLLWTFSEDMQNDTYFVKKCLEAMKREAAKSSFTMTVLNSKNYKSFLKPETSQKIESTIELLKDRMVKQPQSNLKDHFEDIKRKFIVFQVLNENGGVFFEKNVLVTESFEWLSDIERNIYVNKGSEKVKAKYFGFFDLDHSSHYQKHNKSVVFHETEKYMVLFTTVEPYFLAAQPNQAFLTETMTEYNDLLVNPASLPQKMAKYSLQMQVLKGKDLYYEVFYTSQLIVLHRKQQQINSSGRNKHDDTFAIDEYGLMTMNERFYPRKLSFFLGMRSQEKMFNNVAKYNMADMEATTGPMRYMTCMPLEKPIDQLLLRGRQKAKKYFVNPESFFGKHLIANNSEPYVLRDVERSTVNATGKSWDKLPKIIWIYWDTGIKNSKVANKLCIDNIRRAAAVNGFEIRELNDSNTAQYLGPELNEKINNYLKNKKIQTFPQTKSDFVRLGIMIKYGGIYMDVSYFSIKGLEWIVNITQAPSESIFNRYGEMPRAFMFFHPNYGTSFDWTYDKQANTKNMLESAYQNNLLIAQPNQQLFHDWLEEFGRFITSPYQETEQLMQDIGVFGIRWTRRENLYLAAMDSIKNVIAKKNKAIEAEIDRNPNYKGPKTAPQFYGLWSATGYRQQQKFRPYTNFIQTTNHVTNDKNVFLWRYPDTYVQGLIGNISHLIKLYQWNLIQFNSFLNQNFDSNFSDLHPHSFAAKYLYRPELHKLTKQNGQLSLEIIQTVKPSQVKKEEKTKDKQINQQVKGNEKNEPVKQKPQEIHKQEKTEKQQETIQTKTPPVQQLHYQPQPQPLIPRVIPVPQKQPQVVLFQKDPNLMSAPKRGSFTVPQFVWTFSENIQSESFFVKKCYDSMKRHAAKSSFKITVLNSINYKSFLKPQTAQKIENTLELLKDRMSKQPESNLKDHFENIKRRLIVFHVLNEKGGIFLEKNILVTESFQWLNEIESNIYVNKGCGRVRARYFGFFDMDHGSLLQKHNKFGTFYNTQKYMIEFPCIQPYFFAAQAGQPFLTETLLQFIDLLQKPDSLAEKMLKYEVNMGALQGKDLYYEIFYISQHIVLRRRQQQLDKIGANKFDNNFAIDQYGLVTMNERYFPKKLEFYFERHSQEKLYWNLAKYTLRQLEDTAGPMRYITCMMFQEHINYRLERARKNDKKYYIHPDSFIGKHIAPNSSLPYMLKEYEKSTVDPQGKIWENLPRIIWIYWDKGLQNSSIGNKLCIDNIRRAAGSYYQIRELNDSNSAEYLGHQLDEKINNFIKNSKVRVYQQTKSDFLRIAIIAKYGGIYMDASYFSVGGLDWILNITQLPSQMIFNRYGQTPRVVMYFHPHFGTAFDWTYDKEANTKKLMIPAYENNLLIAEPNQQLFWDWLEQYGTFITTPYEQTQQLMKDLHVDGDSWTSKDNTYLAAMDSIKNIMAKKNRQILDMINRDNNYKGPKSAAQFYGIWSISGYLSQQKFSAHTNFDNTYYSKPHNSDNILLWRYSDDYVQGLIGKTAGLIKLYGWNIKYLNKFLLDHLDSNLTSQIHPFSYLSKHLYNPLWHKLTRHGDQLSLQLLKP